MIGYLICRVAGLSDHASFTKGTNPLRYQGEYITGEGRFRLFYEGYLLFLPQNRRWATVCMCDIYIDFFASGIGIICDSTNNHKQLMAYEPQHRILNCRELVDAICHHCDKITLHSLSLCCHATSESALDGLWYTIFSIIPLIHCMPDDLWEEILVDDQSLHVLVYFRGIV